MINQSFADAVIPLLQQCRPGYEQHAMRVARWVDVLAVDHLHLIRLIKAAYVHDLGWLNLVPPNQKLSKIVYIQKKPSNY